ncbi:MAG: HDIG domain-containing protein [Desulfovibrio sp.]|mgnify:CR=1 FL=1|nr:MAG: HDIG domain-containing protein [Desulfovibrio sp.]
MSVKRKKTKKVTEKPTTTERLGKASQKAFSPGSRMGLLFLILVFLTLSGLTGIDFKPSIRVYMAGEVAGRDVTSPQDLRWEEQELTHQRKEDLARSQPPVFDLDLGAGDRLGMAASNVFAMINNSPARDLEEVRWEVSEVLEAEISRQTFDVWRNNAIQSLVIIRIVPLVAEWLDQGVVSESEQLESYRTGVVIRNPGTDEETLVWDPSTIRNLDRILQELNFTLQNEFDKPLRPRKAILELVSLLMEPSLNLNMEVTLAKREEVAAGVEPVYTIIRKGEVIVRQGEVVDLKTQLILQTLYQKESKYFQVFRPLGVFCLMLLLSAGLVVYTSEPAYRPLGNRDAFLVGVVVLIFAGISKLMAGMEGPSADTLSFLNEGVSPFVFPVAGAAGLLALFFPYRICICVNLLLAFSCAQMVSGGFDLFAFYFLGGMIYMFLVKRARTRPELLKSVLPLAGGLLVSWAGVKLLEFQGLEGLAVESSLVLANAVLSLLSLLAFSPIVEWLFGYTSRFRLMELMSLEQPLLQELMVATPGTYHHSLVVSNMVEAGARAVGADPLLCKVGALYHDIGKLNNPQYFIENQMGGRNVHDKLSPSMSALILIAHVKKGVEMAREHKLGQEITDIIRQHHGTSLITYFHNKALELSQAKGGDPVDDENFRYPGPKPQTREAGIVMIADQIEASSRTLVEPTPSRVKGHIQNMVRKIFSEGQLDESELTLKDLHNLTETFHRILTGIFHQRIEYPSQSKGSKTKTKNGERSGDSGPREPAAEPSPELARLKEILQ